MNLKDWLYLNNITLVAFAKKCGISRNHLYHILRGTHNTGKNNRGLKTLVRICKETNGQVSLRDILKRTQTLAERIEKLDRRKKHAKQDPSELPGPDWNTLYGHKAFLFD